MRILAVVADIPDPPFSGARVRNFHLWPAVRELGHEVRVLGLDPFGAMAGNGSVCANRAVEFFQPSRPPAPVRALRAFFRSHYERARSSSLESRLDEVDRQWKPDVIHAEELRMGFYLPAFRGRHTNALQSITLHNVESDLYETLGSLDSRAAGRLQHRFQLRSLRGYEGAVVRAADLLFAYSAADRTRYQSLYPSPKWRATRNGVDTRGIAPCPPVNKRTLLIVGTLSYSPNIRGLWWFLEQVLPTLKESFSLAVAGSSARPEVKERLAREPVTFVDSPRDLHPLYQDSAIVLVPVFEGSGTRTRILEACAYQRMVITTTPGLEGLDLAPGREGVVVADDAAGFAAAIEYWSNRDEERCRIAAEGRRAVMQRYDWSVVAAELVADWDAAIGENIRRRGCDAPASN